MKPFRLEIEEAIDSIVTTSMDTVVIVPCYNEEKRLNADAFVDFARTHPGIRFLFVDDGSRDETLSVLSAMQVRAPHVLDVLALPKNGGKAEAVRQGLIFATKQGVDCVGYFDADHAARPGPARSCPRHDRAQPVALNLAESDAKQGLAAHPSPVTFFLVLL